MVWHNSMHEVLLAIFLAKRRVLLVHFAAAVIDWVFWFSTGLFDSLWNSISTNVFVLISCQLDRAYITTYWCERPKIETCIQINVLQWYCRITAYYIRHWFGSIRSVKVPKWLFLLPVWDRIGPTSLWLWIEHGIYTDLSFGTDRVLRKPHF